VSTWFQDLFHPPRGVLFTFPSRYLFAIGRIWSLALEGGPPCFPQDFTCLVVLRIPARSAAVSSTGLSPAPVTLSNVFEYHRVSFRWSYNPNGPEGSLVWAPPGSLATTTGISVDFFLSGY
jgi:hypothetical protein